MIGIKFGYVTQEAWDAIDWADVLTLLPGAPEEKPKSQYSLPDKVQWVDYRTAGLLANMGFQLEIVPPNGTMITKLKEWQSDEETVKQLEQGAAVQLAIPGFALLAITKVTHLDDACTDELQEMLDKGWKILAVCPPNSQRRPDYILGKN